MLLVGYLKGALKKCAPANEPIYAMEIHYIDPCPAVFVKGKIFLFL